MMEQHDSSNSNADQYFENIGIKKVNFEGHISDSGQESHSSDENFKSSKIKRNNYSKQISNLLKQEENQNGVDDEKTKMIKKNCVSAKMSRQRKKIYIQLLEKKVESLKHSIISTREKLKINRSKIMHYIQESNKEKKVYIEEKMKDSKRLITMSEEFSSLSNAAKSFQYENKKSQIGSVVFLPQIQAHLQHHPQNLQPAQIPPQMQIPPKQGKISGQDKQKQKGLVQKQKSKKTIKNKAQTNPEQIFKQLEEKKQLLQLGINSYLYKFGINGILKNDVVELLKEKWYQLVIDEAILDAGKSEELEKVICDFRDCFWQIDQSNKKLDYLLRQLRDKIKPQYVVKFILEKEFFKTFSASPNELASQNSQLKISHSQEVKEQKQQEQYEPPRHLKTNRQKDHEVSESLPFQSSNISMRHKKSGQIFQQSSKRYENELDFGFEL